MRILITGSRKWTDAEMIQTVLETANRLGGPHTLVHGGARGADTIAAQIASGLGWKVEAHPADWAGPCQETCEPGHRRKHRYNKIDYCPAAGIYRNQRMVDTGADLCLAFIKNRSSGATHCADLALHAGIRTAVFQAPAEPEAAEPPKTYKPL